MTIIKDWITFSKNNDEIMQQMIGEHSRLLIVDSNLTIAYFRDFNSNIPIPLEVGQKLPESSSSGMLLFQLKSYKKIQINY